MNDIVYDEAMKVHAEETQSDFEFDVSVEIYERMMNDLWADVIDSLGKETFKRYAEEYWAERLA